ncbi:MAG: ABC transporter ATP-binding protein, partial [Chloroflexota bacterium]|nr:ABC transporter ATP-binding protein [Chloroflexota bacterium]
ITFAIGHGQTLGVVGESGCGKSITSLSVMRLIERPGKIVAGEVLLNGENLLAKNDADMRDIRGDQVSMIFQEPMTSLNPVFTCGDQIAEAVQQHTAVSRREAWDRSIEMLRVVGIPDAKRRAGEHPHQMSDGMRQRVMIAMALSTDPDLLIADEPTTALDVTIQAQILEVMRDLREKNRMAIMLITHDLGVVAEMADEVVVMYAGKVVERADVRTVFGSPHHPYTQGLLRSIPRLDERRERLEVIKGTVPSPLNLPSGCLFKRRCPYRMRVCDVAPPYQELGPNHYSRCWLTPAGEPPAVGADAQGPEAEQAAEALTVEAR